MLKITGFIFILFSLIITASLFNGIEINDLSYKNINIKKLYLKYDKNLTIDIPQLTIINEKSKNPIKMEINFTLDYIDSLYELDIKRFKLLGTDVMAQGKILLDSDKIDLEKRSELIVQNLNLQFDTKMKNVTAKQVFVVFENKQVHLTFEKAYYDDVDLTNSKVSYILDTNTLKLYLKTTSLITKTLKNAILNYGIEIPVTQHSGKNTISANIFIPFSKGKLFIESNVTIVDGTLESYGQKFDISKLFLNYKNLNLKGELSLVKSEFQNFDIKDSNITYDVSFKKGVDANISTDKLTIVQEENLIFLNTILLQLKENKLEFKSNLTNKDKNINLNLSNTTDLEEKTSAGNIHINDLHYENLIDLKNKDIPYKIVFADGIILTNPTFGLSYFKEKDSTTHKVIIKKPKKLLNSFKFIHSDTQNKTNGYVVIESNDFVDTKIQIKQLSFDLNSSYFKSDTNETKKIVLPTFPKLNLSYNNSEIGYDEHKITFDTMNLEMNNNILNLHLKKDTATIDLKTEDNSIAFNAHNLSDNYINKITNREIFKDGYVNLNIYGDDINFLSGDINLHTTTIKNVTLINSLLTFVNTTPAIINPLLALPTLFRMAQTGFDTTGYYMKNGDGSFRYNSMTKELTIYDLFTNGKMSNFIVNSNVNLATKKIHANVDISFLKDFSKAISYIPIVGYIIMGEDGEFHTSVDITGTLDNPSIETHTVKEGTRGATGIFKRIITLPLLPFNIKTTKEEKIQHDKRVEEYLKQGQD